jgi:hypothetical protein
MQFKHKLIYFALGCAFVGIAQVLLSVVVPKVTPQRKKETVEFDTVKVRSLQVVDDEGKVRAQLEVTKPSALTDDNVIQVFNSDGVPVYQVSVSTDGSSVLVNDGNKKTRVLMNSELISMRGGYGQIRVEGAISVCGNDGHIRAIMRAESNGGRADFCDNDGKQRGSIGINEYGDGVVATWDKNGHRLR